MPRTLNRGLSTALGVAVISTPAAAQTDGVSGGTTAALAVFIAVVAVVLVDTFTEMDVTGSITGAAGRVTSAVTNTAASLTPGNPLSDTTSRARDTGSGLNRFFTSRTGLLILVLVVIVGAAAAGVGTVERTSSLPLFVAVELIAVYLVLQDIDAFSLPVFSLVTAATVILSLSALGEPVIGALAQSPVFPILGVGGLIVAWRAIKAWRNRGGGGTETVVIRGGGGSE